MMSTYAEHALDALKKKGFRITQPRRLVVELLAQAEKPLSAYEIKAMLDAREASVDTVSVYRILDCLEENHLIHRVLSSGKVKKCQLEDEHTCTRHQEEHCHHLLICQKCDAVEEIHCPGTEQLVEELQKSVQFQIFSHNMEFLGLCAQCQSGTQA